MGGCGPSSSNAWPFFYNPRPLPVPAGGPCTAVANSAGVSAQNSLHELHIPYARSHSYGLCAKGQACAVCLSLGQTFFDDEDGKSTLRSPPPFISPTRVSFSSKCPFFPSVPRVFVLFQHLMKEIISFAYVFLMHADFVTPQVEESAEHLQFWLVRKRGPRGCARRPVWIRAYLCDDGRAPRCSVYPVGAAAGHCGRGGNAGAK